MESWVFRCSCRQIDGKDTFGTCACDAFHPNPQGFLILVFFNLFLTKWGCFLIEALWKLSFKVSLVKET
jgi:hypothetical protein